MRKLYAGAAVGVALAAAAGWIVLRGVAASAPNRESASESKQQVANNKTSEEFGFMDIDFARKMIVHNQQGMELALLAESNATDEAIIKLAKKMEKMLSIETDQYISWLNEYDETYTNLKDFPQMDGHDMYPTYPGMATYGEISSLQTLQGDIFEEQFLTLAIQHHKGAQEMTEGAMGNKVVFKPMLDLRENAVKRFNEEVTLMEQYRK